MTSPPPPYGADLPLPRVLVLDYHDSYTNNLLTLFARIWGDEAVRRQVIVVEADAWTWEECQAALRDVDCVILSPGPGRADNPQDILYAHELIRETDLPLLGVCLGMQALAVAYGGKIINTPLIRHGQVVPVRHHRQGVFARLGNRAQEPMAEGTGEADQGEDVVDVVVYNSLAVDETSLPAELRIDAWADEPSGSSSGLGRTIQGLAHRDRPQWGVQFHPESVSSTGGSDILLAFVERVWAFRGRPEAFPPLNNALVRRGATAKPQGSVGSSHDRCPRKGGYLHLVQEPLAFDADLGVEDVFERAFRARKSPLGAIWLDGQSPNAPTTNSMANPAFVLSYNLHYRRVTCHHLAEDSTSAAEAHLELPPGTTFWAALADLQSALRAKLGIKQDPDMRQATSTGSLDARSSFVGGLVGWFAYEMKAEALLGYAADPLEAHSENDKPRADACWAFVDRLLERNAQGSWTARGVVRQDTVAGKEGSLLLDWLESLPGNRIGCSSTEWHDWTKDLTSVLAPWSTLSSYRSVPNMSAFQPDIPAKSYIDGIRKCRDAIHAGDSYELTLTCQFEATSATSDKFGLYRRLRQRNPAPYSAYFHLPTLDTSILSSSPERFIRIGRDGTVQMKPIKGTRARVRCVCAVAGQANCAGPGGEQCAAWCEARDAQVGKELGEDKKERAENLMIVDLIRSDLLSFCKPSSVQVPKLIALESYEKVHQLVTTVVGELEQGITPIEAVQRCFPPGSMTGAPKLRSVQILDELEGHRPRGVYSGALGYISLDGSLDLSVVIRTIIARGEDMSIGAGGAITWLSDPDSEWEEVLTKVGSVTR